jgi:hypothetical protein
MPILGYLIVSLLYMPALIWYLGYRKIPVIAALTVSWLLFRSWSSSASCTWTCRAGRCCRGEGLQEKGRS